MSMYRGNEGGSVWVYFYKHISQGPSTLLSFLQNIVACSCTCASKKAPSTLPVEVVGLYQNRAIRYDLYRTNNTCWAAELPRDTCAQRSASCSDDVHLKPDSKEDPGGADPSPGGTVPSAEIPPATGTLLPHWLNLVYHLSHYSQPHQKVPGSAGTWSRAPGGAGGEGKLVSSKGKERCRYTQSKNEIKRALKWLSSHEGQDKTRTEAGTDMLRELVPVGGAL